MQKWNDIIAINLSSAFHTMQAALPGMASRGFGRVVNIASVHGLVASKDKAPYVASKHGIIGLTRSFANELGKYNIQTNVVCPGFIETGCTAGVTSDDDGLADGILETG